MREIKHYKKALCAMLLCAALTAVGCTQTFDVAVDDVPNAPAATEGAPTSTWRLVEAVDDPRPASWKRIVKDSPFQLGDVFKSSAHGDREQEYTSFGNYPRIDGSTVGIDMAREFARQHLDMSDADLSTFVDFNTTHEAYKHLIMQTHNNYIPFIDESRPRMDVEAPVSLVIATEPSEEELAMAQAEGVALYKQPVCCDAFIFIVHSSNPVESITASQLRDIYTGRITNWSQLGGDDLPIRPFQREKNSGSQTAMEQLVMQGQPMMPAETEKLVLGMGPLIDVVQEYDNGFGSIGYTYKYFLDNQYPGEDIKVLAIDGIEPTEDNIRDGSYPYSTHYYGVIRESEREGIPGSFLEWMLSAEGQECIEQAGYIPLSK